MATTAVTPRSLTPTGNMRTLLMKWLIALLVPVSIFTFVWGGEAIVNNSLLTLLSQGTKGETQESFGAAVAAFLFILLFYGIITTLTGYLIAADSGRRKAIDLWIDVAMFVLLPLLLIIATSNLLLGLTFCAILWPIYFLVRNRVRRLTRYIAPSPVEVVEPLDASGKKVLLQRGMMGGFWFATIFAAISLLVDLIFFFTGNLFPTLLIWVVARTILFPVLGYFLGRLGGTIALRHTLSEQATSLNEGEGVVLNRQQLEKLSVTRAREEATDLVPNDLPLRSRGAQRFYILLLIAFALFYPVIDPYLFGSGTTGRLSGYGDAGYYVILALGLNIVVGFAGLLDLGYVAFFAIGSYVWGIFGSNQIGVISSIVVNPTLWPWLFWPTLLIGALIAALWGVLLGAPTLRLRGDYLAIVTLGFGEIVPIVFRELDKYTNGTNGISGVFSPKFPGVEWTPFTPAPYYYLILALIVLTIFANLRLRDSRLGRAWVAIREDEIAAASSGINLVSTKLFAFGAGAFFSGIAGVYHSAKLGTVSSDAFSFGDSVIYLAMVVIGGLGSIPGVIVGAFAVYALNQLILGQLDSIASDPNSFLHIFLAIPGFTFGNIRNLIFGLILVTVMIFRPEGFIPSNRRRRELRHEARVDEPEEGALDPVPGSPGFESEIRVD